MSAKLTDAQFRWLRWLRDNGGSAWLHGHRVVANGAQSLTGSSVCFLALLLKGAVEVKDARLVITEFGARILKP